MKRIFTVTFLCCLFAQLLSAQATESFALIPASNSSYLARTWTGDQGGTWAAALARTDQTLNSKAICLAPSTSGNPRSVTSPSYTLGMGTLTFNYVRGFTGTGLRSFEVFVNGVTQGTTTVDPNSNTVVNYSKVINISGAVVLQIVSTGASQIIIDDIAWTVAPVLGVDLKSITALKNNNSNKLSWQTATEKNNAQFQIERSQNGETFSKIGEVKGKGTSNVEQNYTFTDATPLKGINYYRLRQVDFDGTESVSKTVSVNFDGKSQSNVKAFPSPTHDFVNVELSGEGKTEISVRDLTGRVVLTQNTEGVSFTTLNLAALSNGLYIMSVRSNEATETVKIQKF